MNSIRPLITISILIAAGVFLYTKINENPAHLVPGTNDGAQSAPGVPPLGESAPGGNAGPSATLTPSPVFGGASNSPGGAAPPWNGTISNGTKSITPPSPPALSSPPAFAGGPTSADSMSTSNPSTGPAPLNTPDSIGLPELPKIPDLPPLPSATEANNSALPPIGPKMDLGDPAKTTSGGLPPMAAAAPSGLSPSAGLSPAGDDRYGPIASAPASATPPASAPTLFAPTSTVPTSFAAEWPAIQTALAQQELGKAHQMLSHWYGNSSLVPNESEQVQSLLNQLAGTVVYSTQSCLEPPYTVRAGDTLESVARQYDVPWQLLAKINAIPAADQVQPGQQLKVLHGPFAAAVDLGKNQMTLLLDGRYAGRFPITVEPNAAASEGQWVVEQKLSNPSTSAATSVYAAGPTSIDHALILRKDAATGGEISITSGPTSPSTPTAAAPPAIHLAPRDADEVADILSVGSHVTIGR